MSNVREVTDATFVTDVIAADLPTVVDFWAPWCGPCRMVAPVVKELSEQYEGKVQFAKLNTDEHTAVPAKYGIRGLPTLLVFKPGEETPAGTIVGFRSRADLQKRIAEVLEL